MSATHHGRLRQEQTFEYGLEVVIGHCHVVFVICGLVGVEALWDPVTARQDSVEPALFSHNLDSEDSAQICKGGNERFASYLQDVPDFLQSPDGDGLQYESGFVWSIQSQLQWRMYRIWRCLHDGNSISGQHELRP